MFISRGPLPKTLCTIPIYRSSEQQQWRLRWLHTVPSSLHLSVPTHLAPVSRSCACPIKRCLLAPVTCWSRERGLCDSCVSLTPPPPKGVLVCLTSETGLDEDMR